MIRFISLFSGSSGNSYFLQVDDNKYLIDAGVSRSKIVKELKKIGENISNIDAIFITHEHIDHIRGLPIIDRNHNIPIFINEQTLSRVNTKEYSLNQENINLFVNKEFKIGDTRIKPFSVSHDAIDPVGFSFFDKKNNKATIATDLGKVTEEVYENILNSDLLVLEANYDDELIRYSEYPISLVNRIVSSKGHLPNSESLNIVSELVKKGLKNIALAHISRNNNNSEIVSQLFESELNLKELEKDEINLKILKHDQHSEEIIIKK